ncbi:MAG: site-specific tyrosine recombinase XerD [Actinomycetia bacterium]|nr:site-specific tyrosine recombinase XerD [Actinomycetes bacterium]
MAFDSHSRLEEYLASLAYERGLAHNTVTAYRRDLRQYLQFVGENEFGPARVGKYLEWLADVGLSPGSVARKLAAVKGYHRFLHEEEEVADPTVGIVAPKQPQRLPKALATHEVFALLDSPAVTTAGGRRDAALLEFLYSTGCRVSEAVGLDLVHLDVEDGIALVTGKGSRQRITLLGDAARRAVNNWLVDRLELARGRTDAVFLNLRGTRLTRIGAWGVVKKAAERAGIPSDRVSPHVLRHSAATHMVEGGADLRAVQEMLGHASLSTTEVYTRISPGYLHEVYLLSHPRSR